MNQFTKNAVNYAFDNKLSDMQDSLEAAIKEKVLGALEAKKIEVAQGIFGVSEAWDDDDEDDDVARADRELARMKAKPIKAAKGVDPEKDMSKLVKKTKDAEEVDEALKGKQHKLDKNKNGKLDSHDFKLLRKESEDLEEKLSVSDGVDAWISDFVHSDDPKFKGKDKKERIQMALGAFYSAKKGKTRNEEVENLDELSKETIEKYRDKSFKDKKDRYKGRYLAFDKITGRSKIPASDSTKNKND